MARRIYAIEFGLRIYKENSDTEFIDFLFGSAAPGGDTGEQDAAPIGSLYLRQNGASSTIYQKIANAGNTSDWQENGSGSLQLGFRSEKVRAVTSENVSPGVRNLTTTPFTDDDGTTLDASDFTVGEFIISNSGGTAVLLEVTDVSAPNVTFSTPGSAPALAEFDTFLTSNYLPDPDGQENQVLVQINGSGSVVKVADVDWNFADGIQLASSYAAQNGDQAISSADSVNSAIEKLDDRSKASSQTGVTTATVLDAVLVDKYRSVVWLVTAFDEANQDDVRSYIVHATNDGTASADATGVDDNVFSVNKLNSNFNTDTDVVLNGTGAAQEMRLQVATSEPGVTYTAVRMGAAKSGY